MIDEFLHNAIRNVSIFPSTLIHCKLRCMIVLIFTSLILILLPNESYNRDFLLTKMNVTDIKSYFLECKIEETAININYK